MDNDKSFEESWKLALNEIITINGATHPRKDMYTHECLEDMKGVAKEIYLEGWRDCHEQ